MWYLSESSGKRYFIISLAFLLAFFVEICIGHTKGATACVIICGVLLFTLAYPYFYFTLRGYYPSGYYVPVEGVNKLKLKDYANCGQTKLSFYKHVSYEKIKLTDIYSQFEDVYNAIKTNSRFDYKGHICFLAFVAMGGTNDMDDSIKASSMFSMYQSALNKYIQEQTAESKKDIQYDID